MANINDPFFERIVTIADALSKFVTDTKQTIVDHAVADPANKRYLMKKPMTALLKNLETIRHSAQAGTRTH
jgi:hypothetical protein